MRNRTVRLSPSGWRVRAGEDHPVRHVGTGRQPLELDTADDVRVLGDYGAGDALRTGAPAPNRPVGETCTNSRAGRLARAQITAEEQVTSPDCTPWVRTGASVRTSEEAAADDGDETKHA